MKFLINLNKKQLLFISIIIHLILILLFFYISTIKTEDKNENENEITIEVEFIKSKKEEPPQIEEEKHSEKEKIILHESNLHSDDFIKLDANINTKIDIDVNNNKRNNKNNSKKINLKTLKENINSNKNNYDFNLFYNKTKKNNLKNNDDKSKLTDKDIYIGKIQKKLYSNWKNKSLTKESYCIAQIQQSRTGDIIGFNLIDCKNKLTKKSVIDAISKTSKLPYIDDFSIFEYEINVLFIVD